MIWQQFCKCGEQPSRLLGGDLCLKCYASRLLDAELARFRDKLASRMKQAMGETT